MNHARGYGRDLPSERPISVDVAAQAPTVRRGRIPRSWLGMAGYVAAGLFLGLMLLFALSIGRDGTANAATSADAVTDNVVHLHAQDIAAACWDGYEKTGPARLTIALEIGIDGKIRYAAASGETAPLRACVEDVVRRWEFLPQADAQTMALPFEVDRR